MTKQRNCPNCAAPYDISLNTCPYCNTSYYDLSSIDFTNGKPFYLKIKINNMYITQKVIPKLSGINIESEDVIATTSRGDKIMYFTKTSSMHTDVRFIAVPDGDDCCLMNVIDKT